MFRKKCKKCVLFLKKCISEKVIPISAPPHLRHDILPFSDSARAYLEEGCAKLRDDITLKRELLQGFRLSSHLSEKLKKFNEQQRQRLDRKLDRLCRNSPWATSGRTDIIRNLSSRTLSKYEEEALSLGLKFSSGKDNKELSDHIVKNYRFHDSESDKGFIQGVLTCCKAISDSEPNALPQRYMKALAVLAKDSSVVITSADKGGGIIILDADNYKEKMKDLLDDENTYAKKKAGYIKAQSVDFNKKARKILKRSERGNTLQHLLEQDPKPPKMRGLPKVHKVGVPLRPITSGLGSAPHRLAKSLAKSLTRLLGSISDSHLKNSGDLLNRLKELDFSGEKMASFDVKALFTNVPVKGAMKAIEIAIRGVPSDQFPVPKSDFLKLVELCLDFQAFAYGEDEYAQVEGLAMGSPLSPVAACLYMEMLEHEQFEHIMGAGTTWLRYVDDIFVLVPENIDLKEKLDQLNAVEERIQFTLETEENGTLPFLDVMIMKRGNEVKYKVYRKDTNREDYIHYLSAHSDKVKSGIVIGFFLRAYRICSNEHLNPEIEHIFKSFTSLRYPKAFIIRCLQKAKRIRRNKEAQATRAVPARNRSEQKTVVVPGNSKNHIVARSLRRAEVTLIETTGEKIGDIMRRGNGKKNENSVVYKVPCTGCPKSYLGETYRGLKTRISEHKRDVKNHKDTSSFVLHIEEEGHMPDWGKAEVIWCGQGKTKRKIMESAVIETLPNINSKRGDYWLASTAAKIIWGSKS